MKALAELVTAVSIPLMILNTFGGIVAGIWLAVLGDWGTIGVGIIIFVFSTGLLGVVLVPSILLAAPAALCAEKGKTFGLVCFGGLGSLYIVTVITLWCCGVLFFFVRDATVSSLIPRLLWSYGLAIGPWAYMASVERRDAEGGENDGFGATLTTFLAQLAYVTIMIAVIFTDITLLGAIKVFAVFMAVAMVIQVTLAVLIQREIKSIEVEKKDDDNIKSETRGLVSAKNVALKRTGLTFGIGLLIYFVTWSFLPDVLTRLIGTAVLLAPFVVYKMEMNPPKADANLPPWVWWVVGLSLLSICSELVVYKARRSVAEGIQAMPSFQASTNKIASSPTVQENWPESSSPDGLVGSAAPLSSNSPSVHNLQLPISPEELEANSPQAEFKQNWPRAFTREAMPVVDHSPAISKDGYAEISEARGYWIGRELWMERITDEFPHLGSRILTAELALNRMFRPAVDNIEEILRERFPDSQVELSDDIKTRKRSEIGSRQLNEKIAQNAVEELEKWATSGQMDLPGVETLVIYHPEYIRYPARELIDGFTKEFRADGSGNSMGLKPRILYPASWQAKAGERPHIVQKFGNRRGRSSTSSVILAVFKIPPEIESAHELEGFSEHEVILELTLATADGIYPNAESKENVDSGTVVLAGHPAAWVEYKVQVNKVGIEFDMHGLFFGIMRHGRLVTITLDTTSVPKLETITAEDRFKRIAPLFQQMLNTFDLFDRYDDPSDTHDAKPMRKGGELECPL